MGLEDRLESITEKVIDAVLKVISKKNSYFDFVTGEFKIDLQKEFQKAKEAALSKIQGIIEFPKADDVFIKNRLQASKSFLSYDLASKILKSMDKNIEILQGISDQEALLTGEYKGDSLKFCYDLREKLNEYLKHFSVFYGSTRRSTGRDKMDYFKMSNIKNQMKKALNEMIDIVTKYTKHKGKDKDGRDIDVSVNRSEDVKKVLKGSSKALEQESEKNKKEAAKKLATKLFKEAFDLLKTFEGVDAGVGKTHILLRSDKEILSSEDLTEEEKNSIIRAKKFTRGLTITEVSRAGKSLSKKGQLPAMPPDERIYTFYGWEHFCLPEAEKQVEPLFRFDDWTKKLKVESPLMGDYADEICESLSRTGTDIDNALNLKDKKIDVKTLLGDEIYAQNSKKFDKQEKYLEKAIDENFYKKRDLVHSKIEKVYNSIKKYRDKEFGTTENEYDNDFKKLIVNDYNIAKKYDELDGRYDELLKTQDPAGTEEFIVQCKEFLEKCKAWDKERIDHEKKEKQKKKDNEVTAARMIKKDKAHYQELCKQLKENIKDKRLLKDKLKIVGKKYDKLRWYVFTYVKKFDDNLKASEDFQKLKVEADGKLMRGDQEVT